MDSFCPTTWVKLPPPRMNSTQAIERTRLVIRRQHKALSTEECYLFWLRRYIGALRAMPGSLSSEHKLETFLTALARDRDVSASTQNQAFNAILFFYQDVLARPLGNVNALRATRPVHERHAPTLGETQLLLRTIRNENGYPTNLIARLLYGCGLRVSKKGQAVSCCSFRVMGPSASFPASSRHTDSPWRCGNCPDALGRQSS